MVDVRTQSFGAPIVDPKTGRATATFQRWIHDMLQRAGGTGDVTLQAAGDDLTAIEALTGTGINTRVAVNTWTLRNIDAGTGFITVVDGDGVSGNPTITIGSATDNIASGTDQTQAGATILTAQFNRVTTHGNTDDGVKLPAAAAGLRVTILNDTATADLQVWPGSDDAIEAGSANAVGVTKTANAVATTYQAVDATTWYLTDQHTTP